MRVLVYLLTTILCTTIAFAAVTVDASTVTVDDTVIYDTGYYTTDGSNWEPLGLNGDVQRGAWYIGSASAPLPQDVTHVAVYSCTWSDAWDCGDDWRVHAIGEDDTVDGKAWSDPATWPSGEVPSPGEDVTITSGMNVVLDESATVDTLTIMGGNLTFARRDLTLEARNIMVMDRGAFRIGSEQRPFEHKATVTLTGTRADLPGGTHCGTKALCSMGGKLALHGAVQGPTWTQLDTTAEPGATTITVKESVDWAVGDEIVIASTSYDPSLAERRTITAMNGNTVTLNDSLDFTHWGEMQYFGEADQYELDQRAEVIHLTRNIVIQGDEQSDIDNFGGHIMAMNEHHEEQMRLAEDEGTAEYIDLWQQDQNDPALAPTIEGVELKRMGQEGILARYPFHWHLYGDVDGSYIKDSSIHQSYQRCVTLHGTQNAIVENNVAFDVIGHCYFLEDGTEWDNTLRDNVGMYIRNFEDPSRRLIASDDQPSVFWWSHPQNTFVGNVAAGAFGFGYWLDAKDHPTGSSATEQIQIQDIANEHVDFGRYEDNVAHSIQLATLEASNDERALPGDGVKAGIGGIGVLIGDRQRGDSPHSFGLTCGRHQSPGRTQCNFVNFTVYYSRAGGFYKPGRGHTWTRPVNSTFADNRHDAYTHMGAHEEGNVFIGASANTGSVGTWGDGLATLDLDTSRINAQEQAVGRALTPSAYGISTETQTQWGLNWQYDGGIAGHNAFINYYDTDYFDRGAISAPGNQHVNIMINSTSINSEPFLPLGGSSHGLMQRDDGTLTQTGQYTEIRQKHGPDSGAFLYDDTCIFPQDGEPYRLCGGLSGLFVHFDLEGNPTFKSMKTGTEGYGGGYMPMYDTYVAQTSTGQYSFNTNFLQTPREAWIVFAVPLDEPYSADGANLVFHGGDEDVVYADTPGELCSKDELVVLYYDPVRDLQYVKLHGHARSPPIPPFYYNQNNGPFGSYTISFDATTTKSDWEAADDIVTCTGPVQPKPTLADTPTVSLETANPTMQAPASITLDASASDSDGIASIEFYRSLHSKLGTDTTAPYAFTWDNVGAGVHDFFAIARDTEGNAAGTDVVQVNVSPMQEPGLVAYWKFDEGTGSLATDQAGTTVGDLNGAQWGDGRVGTALRFDGDADVALPSSDALDTSDTTVTMWARFDDLAGKQQLFYNNDGVTLIKHATNRLGIGTPTGEANGGPRLQTGQWYHLAVTWERQGADGRYVLYVDGSEVGEGTMSWGDPDVGSVYFGRQRNGAGRFLGTMDEVRVYNRALSQSEIRTLAE